jgi:hypothetical protein
MILHAQPPSESFVLPVETVPTTMVTPLNGLGLGLVARIPVTTLFGGNVHCTVSPTRAAGDPLPKRAPDASTPATRPTTSGRALLPSQYCTRQSIPTAATTLSAKSPGASGARLIGGTVTLGSVGDASIKQVIVPSLAVTGVTTSTVIS